MSGIVDIDAATYHADQLGDQPTLSASIAKLLLSRSPRHAWNAHPRLNPNYRKDEDDKFSIGTVAHAILLEGANIFNVVEVCEFDSWRSAAAKEQAAAARLAGKIPLLGRHFDDVIAMVAAAREQIAAHQASPPLLAAGKPEQTITWTENGVHCRARIDWLHDDLSAVDDIKTTSRPAEPASWVRSSLFGIGHDIQAAFYLRGIHAVTGIEPVWRWIVIETAPPFALSVVTPGPDVLAHANIKVYTAMRVWRHCLETDEWPAYEPRVATAELPAWEETRWLEKTMIDEAA